MLSPSLITLKSFIYLYTDWFLLGGDWVQKRHNSSQETIGTEQLMENKNDGIVKSYKRNAFI